MIRNRQVNVESGIGIFPKLFFEKKMRFLLPILLLVLGNFSWGQNLTQSGFTGLVVPKYMAAGTSTRMPVVFRATVSGLTANTTYRYYTNGATNSTAGGGTVDIGTANSGAGNSLLINTANTTYTYTTGPTLTTAGTYETFTTDSSGNFTGWFAFVNTGNARFTAGNIVYPSIVIGNTSGTVLFRKALDLGINVLAFGGAGATNGTFIKSTTSATAKNFAVLFDNTTGTGRPIAVSLIESIGTTVASEPTAYAVTTGTWNAIIPNTNANGVRRIEQRSYANSVIGCATSANGVWPTGSVSTVNPTGGNSTTLTIASADDVLTSCSSGSPTITTTGTLSALSTVYGTASSTGSYTISGANLTNDISISAPAGFEISSTSATSGFSSSLTLTQVSGNVSTTTIYVRLTATTLFGSYSGNVQNTSTGANPVNIAIASSSVTKKPLTVSGASASNKVYDRTTTATISGGSVNGTVNGDTITLSGNGIFASASVGTGIAVTSFLTINGTNATSYSLTQPTGLTADITTKNVMISGVTASNKVYDGTTSATISGTLSGVIAPDDVSLNTSASFSDSNVGTAISVSSTSTLSGADISNYNLVQPTGLSANITAKTLTVSGAVAQNKIYDGNTDATITITSLNGVVAPDDVTFVGTGIFASSGVGTNISVTSTSTIIGDISNYTLVQPTGLMANISSAPLLPQTITFDPLSDVEYGSGNITLTATASSSLPVSYVSSNSSIAAVSGNVVTITGVGFVTITASQSGDLTYDSAATIDQSFTVTPKNITVTATASNKVYDGNDIATVSGTLNGIVGSDVVVFNGSGNFISSDVNTGIAVVSSSTLSGANASNYTLVQPTYLTANITPFALTVTGAVAQNKIYDGTSNAIITGASLVGIIGTDNVTVSGNGNFATSNVGNGIAVSGALVLNGTSASNYSLVQPTSLTANITSKPLTISGLTGSNKIYDATTVATLSGTVTLNGIVGSDDVSLSGTPVATFVNKNVGTAKAISVSGYTLTGSQSGNYSLSLLSSATADITKATLTLNGAIAQNKVYDGTTAAIITGTLSGILGSDSVTFAGSGTFASSAIGTGIAVTSTSTLNGTDAGNYLLVQPTGLSANITTLQFTQGRIVVARMGATGQGSNPTSSGTAVFLDEYTTAGTAGISIALPTTTTGNVNRIVESGSATSEGQLNLSTDGQFLTIGGYDAALGTASVNSTTLINRVIARIDNSGSVATSVLASTIHGSGFRSVVTNDGSRYWTAGNGTGVTSLLHQGNTTAITPTTISSTVTNLRAVNIFNNQLYFSTGSGTTGIYKVGTGLPTTTGQTSVISIASTDPYAYYMVNRGGSNWNCYAVYATGPGIYKWSSADNGATWTARGSVTTAAVYGIIAKVNGSNVDIYATTITSILKLSDTAAYNANISGTATTLATTPSNTYLRGIAFAPVVIAPVITNSTLTANGTVDTAFSTYTITAANSATSFGATGLPSGLTLNNATGQITGTPSVAGVFNVSISATNTAGTDTKTVVITIDKANQTITFGSLSTEDINLVTSFNLTATSATSAINPITYSSSNPLVATISGSVVTLLSSGQTIITASQAGDSNYNAATSVNQTLNVIDSSKQDQTITFNALPNSTYGDSNFDLTATTSAPGLNISYVSSNPAVATVSGATVTIVGIGTTTITASQAGSTLYNPALNVNQTLTVTTKALSVSGATVTPKTYDGTTVAIITGGTLVGVVGSDNVTLSGNGVFADPNVANGINVTSSFVLGGVNAGNYTLTQPLLTGNITPANQVITMNAFNVKTDLEPDFSPGAFSATSSINAITYSSSDTAVATIVSGNIHIVGIGTTTITASQDASQNYNTISTTQNLTVVKGLYLNQFTGVSACPTNGNIASVAINSAGSPLTRNTITCNATANVFNSTTLNNTSTVNDNSYIEFSVSANSSYALNVSSISFFRQASNSAPNQLEVRYSTDNFVTSTSWGAAPLSSPTGSVITWDFTDFITSNAGVVKFRFYPYGTQRADLTAAASAASGTFRLDDVTVYGTVESAPTSSILSGSGTVCQGTSTDLNVVITGGTPPYTVVYNDGTSNITVNNYESGSPITVSPSITTSYSLVSVTDSNSILGSGNSGTATITTNPCSSIVNLKLFVEGYYAGSGTMTTVELNEGASSSTTDVADVTVELHDATSYALVATTVATVHTDGTATCTFATAPSGSFYIAVLGSNFIQTWSANPVTVGGSPLSYDFTTSSLQAYGNNMVEVESGVFAFYSGDINQDLNVDASDYSLWESDANDFAYGVYPTDLNGDGNVDASDYSIWENNANNYIYAVIPGASSRHGHHNKHLTNKH